MRQLIPVTVLLLCADVAVAQTEVPNTFQSGQPARAADVNANFDAVEAGINKNAAEIQRLQGGTGSTWQGSWQAGVAYTRLDLVEFEGSAYIAIEDTSGSENPSNMAFWSLFAAGGAQGPEGPPGESNPSAPIVFDLVGDWTTPLPEIDTPGLYLLGQDLRDEDVIFLDPGLIISASNVTLDLGGRVLRGFYLGLRVTGNNVTVRNGTISGEVGVESEGTNNVFENLFISGGISVSGENSVVRNSRTIANQQYGGGIYVSGSNTLIEGNRIAGLEIGLIFGNSSQGIRAIDNFVECQTLGFSACVEFRGDKNLLIRNTLYSIDTSPVRVLGSGNLISDNIILNNEQSGSTAFTINGTGNIIRGNLVMPSTEAWSVGILFQQDGNFYGNNQIAAQTPVQLGGTVQTDLGGNAQF